MLRILDNSSTQLGLDKLITDPETLHIVQDMVSRPFGLILVTGQLVLGKQPRCILHYQKRMIPELISVLWKTQLSTVFQGLLKYR